MSILYKIIARINPRNPAAPKKFYAVAVRKETTSMNKVSKLVAGKTSLDHVDTKAAIEAAVDVVMSELEEGRAVSLGALGTFSVGISSEGSDTADHFNVASIKKARINYRPGSELVGSVKNFKFEKQG